LKSAEDLSTSYLLIQFYSYKM